jgi:tetratricopeptide (TPR) repeat protein
MPADGLALLGQAFTLQQAGRLADAEALYAKVLAASPDDVTALVNAGAVALSRGDLEQAIARFERVAQLAPNNAIVHNNLGLAYINAGRDGQALVALDRAIRLKSDFAQAHNNRGIARLRVGRRADAIASFERALALQPGYADAALNLAERCNEAGDAARAIALFQIVLAAQPGHVQAQTGRAFAQALAGDLPASIEALERVTASAPGYAAAWQTLGAVRNWAWQHDAAESAFRRALALDPELHDAAFGVASTLLARGNYTDGWTAFEQRPDRGAESGAAFAALPVWDGRAFDGTLIVYGEQGFGDAIQFARFIAAARARAGRLVLLLDGYRTPLAPLLERVPGVDGVATRAEDVVADSAARRVSILSLPQRLAIDATRLVTTPRYLAPPPARAHAWRARMEATASPRVGLAWSVLPRDGHGFVTRHKSVPGDVLARVLATPATTFVTLQPGAAGNPATLPATGHDVLDVRAHLHDFADTAALIDTLDLVLSADTAVAHLAGALGKPVWLLDRYNTCWRWRAAADASPWYPTLRIFRQQRFGDWSDVASRLAAAFAEWRGAVVAGRRDVLG